jgi:hypothetical protein
VETCINTLEKPAIVPASALTPSATTNNHHFTKFPKTPNPNFAMADNQNPGNFANRFVLIP